MKKYRIKFKYHGLVLKNIEDIFTLLDLLCQARNQQDKYNIKLIKKYKNCYYIEVNSGEIIYIFYNKILIFTDDIDMANKIRLSQYSIVQYDMLNNICSFLGVEFPANMEFDFADVKEK